jgi:acetyl esterase/lipase
MSVLHRVDPELRQTLALLPNIDLSDIPAARAALHAVFAAVDTAPANPAVARTDHQVPGRAGAPDVLLRAFRPAGAREALPCLFWIQGGGYVLTAADLDDQWCEAIAHALHCAVYSVQWRRAPENPFPAASDDCYAGLSWVVQNAAGLLVDPACVVVGGASSGGGAAAGVALRIRDQAQFSIAHQLLLYPMLDDRNVTPSSHAVTDPELWSRHNNEIAWRAYLGGAHGTDRISPYAAPTRARDLKGLAPATILTAELDLFVDENIEYAQRLMHAGVPTELHVYPAANHGFDRLNPAAAVSRRLYADRDDALRRAFANARSGGQR